MGRAVVRLVLMVLVLAGVLIGAAALGLPTAAVAGLALSLAGIAGVVELSRRRRSTRAGGGSRARGASDDPDAPAWGVDAAMAPNATVDPEANIPRWRRPSLLAARKSDPMRTSRLEPTPLRFAATAEPSPARRIVRYAVVALLDRPDEVLGRQVWDLLAGDEVEVLESGSSFWEVLCPDGTRGWVHRTTLGMPGVDHLTFGRRPEPQFEADDILSAVLAARGLQT
jgi:hypothetical protein